MAILDKICCTLAALGGCTLNRGSFACKFVRGDMQLAAKGRGTLNRGGRNCRWDCIKKINAFKLVHNSPREVNLKSDLLFEDEIVPEPNEPLCEKTGLRGFDQVPHKPGCRATQDGQRLDISYI